MIYDFDELDLLDYNEVMRIDVFTIFPEIFPPYLNESILKRAQESGLLEVGLHNIRDWAADKHKTTDDEPYGGGGGMVMKPEPIFAAYLNRPPTCLFRLPCYPASGRKFEERLLGLIDQCITIN